MLEKLALLAPLALAIPVAQSQTIGDPYCFGTECPCGNNDPTAGCVNSTGFGALLSATGSESVLADDAVFTATSVPASSVSLLVMSMSKDQRPFFDGTMCIGSPFFRLYDHQNSGQDGVVNFNSIVEGFSHTGVVILPGDTWHMQVWFRDAPAKLTPCHMKANMTNGLTVTFTP